MEQTLFNECKKHCETSYNGKHIKDHWLIPRAKRAIPNQIVWGTLKIFKKTIVNKKNNLKVENNIRNLCVENLIMSYAKNNNTGKEISHIDIKSRPGAIRTIIAEYIAIGLIYRDITKKFHLTQAGQDILKLNYNNEKDTKEIDKIITHLLFRLQFNSEYFHSSKVRMNTDIKLKPFCFLIKLMKDSRLNFYLTKEDMYILYLKAKNINDYEMIVKSIVEFRKTKDINKIIGFPIHKIPGTIKNQSFHQILTSRNIIKKQRLGFTLNTDYLHMDLIEKYIEDYTKDLGEITTKQHGKLRYETSSIGHKYDNQKLIHKLSNLANDCSTITSLNKKLENYAPSVREKMKSIIKNNPKKFKSILNHKLELDYLQPGKGEYVEHKLKDIFNNNFRYETECTGRINNGLERGRHSDNLNIFREQRCCGIIESKVNHKMSYSISTNAHRAMETHIKSYLDLLEQLNLPTNFKLSYACFISSGFSDNTNKNLSFLSEIAGIPISAITISDLIIISDMNIHPKHFIDVMNKSRFITWKDFITST